MIVEALHLRCELDILMLVPQRSFAVFHSGDLDNRIKTLIDGLRLPTGQNEVSDILVSNTAKDPYNVLLEDDRLITSVSAKSDVLLGATQQEIEDGVCRAIIKVHFFPISPTMDTFALIG